MQTRSDSRRSQSRPKVFETSLPQIGLNMEQDRLKVSRATATMDGSICNNDGDRVRRYPEQTDQPSEALKLIFSAYVCRVLDERHTGNNVVFSLRTTLGYSSQPDVIPEVPQTVPYFRTDAMMFEEKSNQFKSRKFCAKDKPAGAEEGKLPTGNKTVESDEGEEEEPNPLDVPGKAEDGIIMHANALALSETFFKMDITILDDQKLLKYAIDSKEVSWAFQLFLLNCDLSIASMVAGRFSPFAMLLIGNIYGNYAMQKLAIRLPAFRNLVLGLCRKHFWKMVYNQYSSRVLQMLSEINKPFAHFALESLLQRPQAIGGRIETAFLFGAALRSIKGTPSVSALGCQYLEHYARSEPVAKGKFSKKVLLTLAQNAEADLLDRLQALLISSPYVIKQYLGDRSMMQFLSTMILKLHKPSLEVLFRAVMTDELGVQKAVHAASFFKKVGRHLVSSAAKEVEQRLMSLGPAALANSSYEEFSAPRKSDQTAGYEFKRSKHCRSGKRGSNPKKI